MTYEEPKCFMRDLDRINHDSTYMGISIAMMQIKSGICGNNFSLIEPYIIDNDIPQVLRTIAKFNDTDGFMLVDHDEVFEVFIKSLGIELPQSKCLKYLRKESLSTYTNI